MFALNYNLENIDESFSVNMHATHATHATHVISQSGEILKPQFSKIKTTCTNSDFIIPIFLQPDAADDFC